MAQIKNLAELYKNTLLDNVLPFWSEVFSRSPIWRLFYLFRSRRKRLRYRQVYLATKPSGVDIFYVL